MSVREVAAVAALQGLTERMDHANMCQLSKHMSISKVPALMGFKGMRAE